MYGVKSEISDDWIPGVFSTIWEKSNKRSNKHTTWITCDGPVGNYWGRILWGLGFFVPLATLLNSGGLLVIPGGVYFRYPFFHPLGNVF